jgi:hypothetical protein
MVPSLFSTGMARYCLGLLVSHDALPLPDSCLLFACLVWTLRYFQFFFIYKQLYPFDLLKWILIIHLPFVTERRQAEANRIREKYPDRIPVSFYSCWFLLYFFMIDLFSFKVAFLWYVGHCWEGREKRHPRHWQEKVSPFLSLRVIPLHFCCSNGFPDNITSVPLKQ